MNTPSDLNGFVQSTVNEYSKIVAKTAFSYLKNVADAEDISYLPQEQNELLLAILSLDVKYRLPIHLYYYEGYSINEISEILEERASTIGTRLARGRKLIKNLIGGLEDE